jgi:nitric oxide reductase large subunit
MPIESRLFVKTSIVALVLAFAGGALLALSESLGKPVPQIWAIEHAHLAFVGWLVNVVIGIALWMLPLNREAYPDTAGRYPKRAPMIVWALLNGGLVLRIASEPLAGDSPVARAVLALSASMQFAAVLLFAFVAWRRVRAPARPAPGVR